MSAALLAVAEVAASCGVTLSNDRAVSYEILNGSTWSIRVFDKHGAPLGTVVVRLTGDKAVSCMQGTWRAATVLSFQSSDPDFVATRPMSYSLDDDEFILGANEICDDYLWLHGRIAKARATGRYESLGLGGSTKLGSFKAVLTPEPTAPN